MTIYMNGSNEYCQPLNSFQLEKARLLQGLFFDIDGTFTYQNKIIPSTYQTLWNLKASGLRLAAITGRSAGWCDHMARLWPVDAVIGENGGFYFCIEHNHQILVKRFLDDEDTRAMQRRQLKGILQEILHEVPGASSASDQPYRETDLGIDYSEDVPRLSDTDVARIKDIFEKYEAKAAVSSIHINGHLGKHDKLSTTLLMAREVWGLDLETEPSCFAFCGDSANDEPMFRHFPLSFGVRNIEKFYGRMNYLPAFLAEKEGGQGFQEIAETILKGRLKLRVDAFAAK